MSRQFLTIREILSQAPNITGEERYDITGMDPVTLGEAIEEAIIKKVEASRAITLNQLVGRRLENARSEAKVCGGRLYGRPAVMKKFRERCNAMGQGRPHSLDASLLKRIETGEQPLSFILAVSICKDLGIGLEELIPTGFIDEAAPTSA